MEKGIEALLEQHPFFADMTRADLVLIAGCGSNKVTPAGEYLAREGQAANEFIAIRHGRVALDFHVPGRGAITIQTVPDGEVVGWSWLFPPYKWMFGVRAVEMTRAIHFDCTCLRNKCDDDPRLGYDLMKRFAQVFAQRIEATRLQLLDVYGAKG